MSDPIQSISQSNYVLHNIDAKKLYVQEPLFTANSGDAVYVGWRPDETVLFLHSSVPMSPTGTVYQMSEPITHFERIKVEYWNREFKYMRTTNEFFLEGTSANDTRFCTSLDVSVSTGNQQRLNMAMTYNASGNLVDSQHALFFANGGSVTTGNERGLGVHRVIGINRISGGNA